MMAAKNTPQLIPYCHSVALDWVGVEFELGSDRIEIVVRVKAVYKTGVEMEALAGAAAAALNIYDLLKPVDDDMVIERIELLEKTGGKSNARDLLERSWRAAVLVCSDRASAGEYVDRSGPVLVDGLTNLGAEPAGYRVVRDEVDAIQSAIREWVAESVDIVFVSGGSGLADRDVTPAAVVPMLEKRLSGVEAHYQSYSQARVPTSMLSRPVAGLIGKTLVVTIPGSPGAAQDALDALFPYLLHALDLENHPTP